MARLPRVSGSVQPRVAAVIKPKMMVTTARNNSTAPGRSSRPWLAWSWVYDTPRSDHSVATAATTGIR